MAQTPVRFSPSFLPGARAPGLTFIFLSVGSQLSFHISSLFKIFRRIQALGVPLHFPQGRAADLGGFSRLNIGKEGVPAPARGKKAERPLSFSKTPAVPGARPGFFLGGVSLVGSFVIGEGRGGNRLGDLY